MGALLGVGMGSSNPSRLVTLEWNGNPSSKKASLGLVGKGVTFDTGGISIKPSEGMEEMKMDMGGSALVLGVMKTLALRKAKTNVVGVIGLVENMVSSKAQRPSDIVKSMSGKTIEVLNTDAEGRLVLADALWYCQEKFKVKTMINFATLTGAIIVALGDAYAGLFSNSDDFSYKLIKSGRNTDEKVWQLPLGNEYDELLDCDIADVKNITGTKGAGSITAAQFLKRFVNDEVNWAHLDIAGVAWINKDLPLSKKGGTGFGIRLINDYISNNFERK
jgi:leucyl aminopeptidase